MAVAGVSAPLRSHVQARPFCRAQRTDFLNVHPLLAGRLLKDRERENHKTSSWRLQKRSAPFCGFVRMYVCVDVFDCDFVGPVYGVP